MRNAISKFFYVLKLLVVPMTATKFIKLCLLAFIFVCGFAAWGKVISGILDGWIGSVLAVLGYPVAILAFIFCQFIEVEVELMTLGTEEPEQLLKKVRRARVSHTIANMLAQDYVEEFGVEPIEIKRAKQSQFFAFVIDLVLSSAGYWPFSGSLWMILVAPLGLLDFNIFNAVMLIVTVFFTPRILKSAMTDGRFAAAKGRA